HPLPVRGELRRSLVKLRLHQRPRPAVSIHRPYIDVRSLRWTSFGEEQGPAVWRPRLRILIMTVDRQKPLLSAASVRAHPPEGHWRGKYRPKRDAVTLRRPYGPVGGAVKGNPAQVVARDVVEIRIVRGPFDLHC